MCVPCFAQPGNWNLVTLSRTENLGDVQSLEVFGLLNSSVNYYQRYMAYTVFFTSAKLQFLCWQVLALKKFHQDNDLLS